MVDRITSFSPFAASKILPLAAETVRGFVALFGLRTGHFTNPLGLSGSLGWISKAAPRSRSIRGAFNLGNLKCRWMSPVSVHSAF